MANITGSIKRVDIDGITYEATGDGEPIVKSGNEKETTPTSGEPIINITKQVKSIESVTLSLSPDQHNTLEGISEDIALVPIAITTAAGKVYRDNGTISLGDYALKAATCDLTLIPGSVAGWTLI